MLNIEQTEEYKNKLSKMLENQKIDYEITKEGLKKELERYKKNMDVVSNMLALAEIRALEKSDNSNISSSNFLPTYQILERVIEGFSDPDVTIPLVLDFNEYSYIFENYPYEQLKILEKKYEGVEEFSEEFYDNFRKIVSNNKIQEVRRLKYDNITGKGLNLGTLDQMDIYYSVFVNEALNSDMDIEKKTIIFDSLIRSILKKSQYVDIKELEENFSKLRKQGANIDEVIEFYKKNCDKKDLFEKTLNYLDCYKSFNVEHCIDTYNIIDKYADFNETENIDFATNLKISSIPYVIIRCGDDSKFLKLFESESYKKLPEEIKENDIVALLFSKIGSNFSLKNVIGLDSFKINDMNMSLICGIITDWCNGVASESKDDKKRFNFLFEMHYNDEINNVLRELYKKANTTEEKELLDTYVERINDVINSTIDRFYIEKYKKEVLRNDFSVLLNQTSKKVNNEFDTKYPNSKVNKKLKRVLTVSEILNNEEDE